jgi:ABC-type Zn2+ transport system substrate-binding protein/surface adhesin
MGFQELQHGLRLMNIHINRDDWQVCLSLLAYVFSRQQVLRNISAHTHAHTHTHTNFTHTHTHAHTHARTQHTHTHTHTHTHVYILHVHLHTYIHKSHEHTCTPSHTHTFAHTQRLTLGALKPGKDTLDEKVIEDIK